MGKRFRNADKIANSLQIANKPCDQTGQILNDRPISLRLCIFFSIVFIFFLIQKTISFIVPYSLMFGHRINLYEAMENGTPWPFCSASEGMASKASVFFINRFTDPPDPIF